MLEHVTGPTETVNRVERHRRKSPVAADALGNHVGDVEATLEVLGRTEERLECHYRIERTGRCETPYTLAADYLGTDVLFEFERTGRRDCWRMLLEDDERMGLLYDAVQAALRPEVRFEFRGVNRATGWRTDLVSRLDVPVEQRTALELAVDQGYYEAPREVTLDELAEVLNWPRSTLSYRLRRAEGRLAKAVCADDGAIPDLPKTVREEIGQ